MNDPPSELGEPGRRALRAACYRRLGQLTKLRESEVRWLHGVGPKALGRLLCALAANNMSFAEEKSTEG